MGAVVSFIKIKASFSEGKAQKELDMLIYIQKDTALPTYSEEWSMSPLRATWPVIRFLREYFV